MKVSNLAKKILPYLTILIIVFISLYALFYQGLSFDGAFHSQAAINLYKYGKYVLDYPLESTQIKLPFQIVNGFFLTIFGMNFISANLANIFFYIIFGWLFFKLSKRFKSQYILVAFILISFSNSFILWGFKGYGEVPALVFGLFGILLLTNWTASFLRTFFGAFLIGTAIATKWVLVLIILPFGIIMLYQLINRNYKFIIYSIFGFFLSLLIFWSIEYANDSVDLLQLLVGIINHTTPVNNNFYASYSERLIVFWNAYIQGSGNLFIAILKIIAYLQAIILLTILIATTIKNYKVKQRISSNQLFVLIISLFAIEYFLWWFFLGSKPWYRRGFNADILLVIALALPIKETFSNIPFRRVFHYSAIIIIFMICVFNVYDFFSHKSNELFTIKDKGSIILESQMRTGLNMLPEGFVAYGYGWWQAPRWSFLSGTKHKDLENLSIKEKYEIANGVKNKFVFFEKVNYVNKKLVKSIHEQFQLTPVFEYKKYSIQKLENIVGFSDAGLKAFINYSKFDYIFSKGVYSRHNGYCWYSQDAKILLNSINKTKFVLSFHVPDIKKYSTYPYLSIFFNDNLVYKEQLTTSGFQVKEIEVQKEYNLNKIIVKVQVSKPVNAIDDSRNLGILVREIGFK